MGRQNIFLATVFLYKNFRKCSEFFLKLLFLFIFPQEALTEELQILQTDVENIFFFINGSIFYQRLI